MLRALHGAGSSSSSSSKGVLLHGAFAPPLPAGVHLAPTRETRNGSSTHIMAIKSPKGFGPPPPKSTKPLTAEQLKEIGKTKEEKQRPSGDSGGAAEDDEVPQLVMDRMIKRIGVSLGIPLVLAVVMFPFFWYLKIKVKLDIPEWLPLLVSGTLFGFSAFGITYGILSTSWDPLRDGSFVGWKEAKANWPIFFDNLQGKQGKS